MWSATARSGWAAWNGCARAAGPFTTYNSGSTTSELDLSDAPAEQQSPEAESSLVELFAKTVSGDVRIERAPARSTGTELSGRS